MEIIFAQPTDGVAPSQGEILPSLCTGVSEEHGLPVYDAHPCLDIGQGRLGILPLAALTGRPTVGRLEKLAFLLQKVPQVDLERITVNVTNWLEYSGSFLSGCLLISNIS